MPKLDLKQGLLQLYSASPQEPTLVSAPRLHFLMLDGRGDPDAGPEFQQAVEALFGVSYALKFMVKKHQGMDYTVMPLEGLWWVDDKAAFTAAAKDRWEWTLMIGQPEVITPELVDRARDRVRENKNLPLLDSLRFSAWCEGEAAQILHVGPFSDARAAIVRLQAFIREKGYQSCGRHHEIYLSDPRRTSPAKFKTIIRQPVTLEAMK